jgi:glutamine synthetase
VKPDEVMKFAQDNGVKLVDVKFTDLPGTWQHFTVPMTAFSAEAFDDGLGFDGSSIRGFQEINESDMLLLPDPNTAHMDPFHAEPTLSVIGDVVEPLSRVPYSRDPRYIARKAEKLVASSGIADAAYFGPEAEFFVFDDVRFQSSPHNMFFAIDSVEGHWNSGRDEGGNQGYKIRGKEGYFPVSPHDTLGDLRGEMILTMAEYFEIDVETHHHEVASAGQCEIDMRFDTLLRMADNMQAYKYVVKNVAARNGKVATFMPKPLFGDNGSGMHVHQSLWKGGKPLFFDEGGYAGLSKMALSYIAGLLLHAPAILAFAAPTTNSYRRLVPGFEAPVNLVFSARNRSAAVRIPMYSNNPKAKRIEFRPPDPSANPYLTFAALLCAGLDGVRRGLDPTREGMGPLDRNIYEMNPEDYEKIRSVPGSLDDALIALENDNEFLLADGVFTPDVLDTWIGLKRATEVDEVRLRPTPHEYHLYFDV